MKKRFKYLVAFALFLSTVSLFSVSPDSNELPISQAQEQSQRTPKDSASRYPVKKTQIMSFDDLDQKTPIDLKDPSNVKTEIEYDIKNNIYLFKTKVGDDVITTPFSMSADEYIDYSLKQAMAKYFRSKNEEAVEKKDEKDDFSLKDIKISLGQAEKIFGPGGVRVKTQGYTEVSMGMKHSSIDKPTLSEKNKSRLMFDFDQKIQMNINASVGDKVNFGMNYDTESTFDFDSKKLKLAYEGKEDEIIRHLEAGNVSMSTTNSLINGGTALFGIKADLQFGKLKVSTVLSQQESQSQTVNSKGGAQTTSYEFMADQYDENRHFFLAQYFRSTFDKSMSKLPKVLSNITIDKIEVWVTNNRGNFDKARDIVALADLGESTKIKDTKLWNRNGTDTIPYNRVNNEYDKLITDYAQARDISSVTSVLGAIMESGLGYEKLESARLLESTEYTFNAKLGYLSLNSALQANELLAVAFKYTLNGVQYQVGEFSADIPNRPNTDLESNTQTGALFVKLLKPTSFSPQSYTWHLMMKNIYSLGAYQVQKDRFRLNISYLSDTTGTYLNYIQEGAIKDSILLRVMNLDRLDARNNVRPQGDGIFDFVEDYTIIPRSGRVIFPVVEPFGSHLRERITGGNPADSLIAKKYVYQELYDSTLTVARQVAEKNKFKISGVYRASSANEINLGATNVAKGSVRVTAAGVLLQEGVDYTVDYISGIVTLINESYSTSSISVSLENQSFFSMQKKTMMGLNLSYDFSKDFNIGATIIHMYEKPMTVKTAIGNESLKNTLWGTNLSYRTQSQWLTNMVDKLPFVNATQPSQIALNAEFAQMIPGHVENKYGGGYSYLDDFESAKSKISLGYDITAWKLSPTPNTKSSDNKVLFDEATFNDSIPYGINRALLSWYSIDRLFTRRSSSLAPDHIKNDKDQLSNHYVREVDINEIYPNRQTLYNESGSLYTFDLSYYPNERGPYNLDVNLTQDGYLKDPEKRWGGIMRKIQTTNFEVNNIEYLEFWMMDPFIYNSEDYNPGGDLYINLGSISEDILRDGKKFYENGLPIDGDPTAFVYTSWGKVPTRQSTTYSFDSQLSIENKRKQDVGLNGLSTEEEREYGAYKNYLNTIQAGIVSSEAFQRFYNDPAGDNFHHFRGSDYDRDQKSILDRYKYYNNTEGNSTSTGESYSTNSSAFPDVEDVDQDYTLNETEAFYQYKINLKNDGNGEMKIGENYIVDRRKVKVKLRNDNEEEISWYLFRIPLKEKPQKIGNIQDFTSIRFMRMFLTGFEKTTHLRFATLDLVRGEWRKYTHNLNENITSINSELNVSAINIEENGDRQPVNYVLPPDVSRVLDPNQATMIQENEQSLALQVLNLEDKEALAVYKNTSYDLRRYKRLQMYTHLEEILNESKLNNKDLRIFIRLGSDYKNNYYEYEIPMVVTPHGKYTSSYSDRLIVWPKENMFDFSLELLKDIKLERNKEKRRGGSASYTEEFWRYDPDNQNNKVTVVGNPSLSDVRVMMIGVRNTSGTTKSGEVWVDELRVTDFDEEGGWAAQGSLNVNISDIGSVSVSGRKETIGFGSIDQSLMERRADDFTMYNIATNLDLGRFLPEKAKLSIPFFYSYSSQTTSPKYDPLDQDVTLKESLELVDTKQEKDSIKNLAEDRVRNKSINFNNVKLNIKSETPMPYDPANFSVGYSFNEVKISNPTTTYDISKDYKASLNYSYSPLMKTWAPFKDTQSKAPMSKFAKSLAFNYLPSNISFNSLISRFYTETMIRDIESYSLGNSSNNSNQFLSWSQEFYWDRDFSLTWDFTRNLKFSFRSGTRAEIEEPYMQVNKNINRDDYDEWKREVTKSILALGNPLEYRQNTKLTYSFPFNNIPFLDWINATGNYESNYKWDKGATTDPDYDLGNTINNSMTLGINSRFNMLTLYNKSSFLKAVNQKFDTQRRNAPRRPATPKKKKYEVEISLADSTVIATHNLNTKNIRISAKLEGRNYPIKYKRIDNNKIRILNQDSVKVNLTVIEGPDPTEGTLYKIAQYAARGLMSVRSISINISNNQSTYLPSFKPSVGDAFGQKGTDHGTSPGLGFAFGFEGGEEYINKAINNDWLIRGEQANIDPAVYNQAERIDIKADLEPFKGLKISLNALREKSNRTSFQFMYDGMPRTYGGSFSITTISLGSAFQSGNANNNYQSKVFDKFLENRDIIANRLESKYANTKYPSQGFINTTDAGSLGGSVYNPENGAVGLNSPDVLIPAFLAAYTGKDPNSISTSLFPALSSILPNWAITYDGLTNIGWFKRKFKSLKLTHSYVSQYRVGSYSSFPEWVAGENGTGYRQSTLDGKPLPSSPYDIGSVSITEAFNPLFGAEGTLNNSMTIRARYNTSRTLNLNMTAYQIVEAIRNEFIIGFGYRINEFNRVLGITSRNAKGFNNDLNINVDLSHSSNSALIRKIEDRFTQATSGTKVLTLKATAEYAISRSLSLKAYLDRIMNTPLISATSYPTTNTDFGISLRFTLSE